MAEKSNSVKSCWVRATCLHLSDRSSTVQLCWTFSCLIYTYVQSAPVELFNWVLCVLSIDIFLVDILHITRCLVPSHEFQTPSQIITSGESERSVERVREIYKAWFVFITWLNMVLRCLIMVPMIPFHGSIFRIAYLGCFLLFFFFPPL